MQPDPQDDPQHAWRQASCPTVAMLRGDQVAAFAVGDRIGLAGGAGAGQVDGTRLARQALRLLRRHWLLFCSVAGAVLILGLGAMASLKPRYTATATVAIASQAADPLAPTGAQVEDRLDDDRPATEAAMLQSRDVAAAVLDRHPPPPAPPPGALARFLCSHDVSMACPRPPDPDPRMRRQGEINAFLDGLTVLPELHSRIIDVSVTDRSGTRAATLADAVVASYQRLSLDEQTANVDRVARWLDDRTGQLRQRWLDAEQLADRYDASHQLLNTGADASADPLINRQIQQLAANLSDAQARLAAANARAQALADAKRRGDPRAVIALGQQPILVTAANTLLQLQSERDHAAAHLGANHPELQALDRQIAVTRATLGSATGAALSAIREDAVSAQAEVSELTANLDRLRGTEEQQSGPQAVYRTLSQEAQSARSIYETFLDRSKAVVDRAALLQPPVTVVSHAVPPSRPSFPNHAKLGAGILVVAVVLGAGAVLLRAAFSEEFQEIGHLREAAQVPLLGTLPRVSARRGQSVASFIHDEPFSRAGEAVRGLAAQLTLLAGRERSAQSILITSAMPQEGKSTLAVWLAAAVRQGERKVVVIDADHRRGSLFSSRASAVRRPGFTDLLSGDAGLSEVIRTHGESGIDFVGCGASVARPFGPEEIDRLRHVLAELKRTYGMVIIDSPPLMAMSDALIHAQVADQTLFVCRWQHSSRDVVTAALDRLRTYAHRCSGIVVTMVEHHPMLGETYSRRELALVDRFYRA